MTILTIIISIIVTGAAFYYLFKKPVNILVCYLFALPLLPPIPFGSIEITILDMLTIPALIALVYHITHNRFKLQGYFNTALLLYLFAALISFVSFSLQTGLFSISILMRLVRLCEMIIPVLLASYLTLQMRKENILTPFFIGGALSSLIAILFYAFGYSMRISQSFTAQGIDLFRAAGTHGDSGSFGNFAGLLLLVAIWAILYPRPAGKKLLHNKFSLLAIMTALITATALIISLSRGGTVLFIIGLAILIIPLLKYPIKILKIVAVVLLIILIGSLLINTFVNNELISVSLDAFWNRITGLSELTEDFEQVSSSRSYYWQKTWELFKENPSAWPFGLGYKAIPLHYNLLADNNFNQALFEMGIFGAISIIFMVFSGFLVGFKTVFRDIRYGIIILAIWFGLFSNMITADILTYWHNVSIIFILMIYFSSRKGKTENISSE